VRIRFKVYPLGRLVRYEVEGPVTPDDARQFLDAVLGHRHFEPGFDFLGQRRGSGGAPDAAYPPAVAREVRARVDLLTPCRWAVVVSSPSGLEPVRLLADLTREGGVRVTPFATEAEATKWLAGGTAERLALGPTS
jgi:hypothetical protein